MTPPLYRLTVALDGHGVLALDRVCALTPGFGVEDALAYLSTPAAAKASHEPKTRAA